MVIVIALPCPGTTAEEFIMKDGNKMSKKEKFHRVLAQALGLPLKNVDIITVMDNGPFTDVRYAAHGSPYYQSSQTDSAVVRNLTKVGVVLTPVGECGGRLVACLFACLLNVPATC